MMRVVLVVAAMVLAAGAAAVAARMSAWNGTTASRVAQLNQQTAAGVFHEDALAGLPAPAARYFRHVLKDGQPIVTAATTTQEAEFFINGAWQPLRARQHFTMAPPGFVWDARITIAPLLAVRVRDSYVAGSASMTASFLGVHTIVDQNGVPQLNSGALQRLLGEFVWFPTALLPGERVTWTAHDDRSAVVTLRDSGEQVSLLFGFGDDDMVRAVSGDRFKEANGSYVIQRWEITCDQPGLRAGMLIPLRCEVAWIDNGQRVPYWRGRITSIEHAYD